MTATIIEATDAILTQFKTTWDADSESMGIAVAWPDTKFAVPTSDGSSWARVTLIHNPGAGGQATLSGDTGQRRYRRFGVITVQVFTPFGGGQTDSQALARVAMSAFEGVDLAPSGVIFRNARFTEVGQDGAWLQTNITSDFEYDEVR
jgi:hypothetical protein